MGEDKKFLDKLNDSFLEFVGSAFGESMKESLEETQGKIKDFSSDAIKNFMEFSDSVLEQLNLHENEQVLKKKDSIEDMLKQAGLLKEEEEEEF